MRPLSESIEIAASPERTFEALSDLASHAELFDAILRIEVLTDGPVGVGTRFRETRVMFKKEASEEMEITSFDPPNGYVTEAHNHGAHYISTWTVKAQGDGAVVERRFEARTGLLMSILFAPMALLMKKAMVKALRADLESLKAALEGGPSES